MEQENRVRMERIAADPQSGLSAEQVKRRFAQGENNYKVESSTLSVPEIVRSNVCTYFNLVFAVIAVLHGRFMYSRIWHVLRIRKN